MADNGQGGSSEEEQRLEGQTQLVNWETLVRLLARSRGGNGSQAFDIATLAGILDGENDDDDDDEYTPDGRDEAYSISPRQSRDTPLFPPVTEPKEEGVKLLMSGEFGRVGNKMRARQNRFDLPTAITKQATAQRPVVFKEDYVNSIIPNTNGTTVAEYAANVYTGQYSQDSSFYYTCSQDFELHIYDTTQPLEPRAQRNSSDRRSYRGGGRDNVTTRMPIKQAIQGQYGGWTITDANVSPDNERIIYSSICADVYMTKTREPDPEQKQISFRDQHSTRRHYDSPRGIYSCKFSADGNEVIAGGDGDIFVYDLLADRRTVKIRAHEDDVNSCCWADTASGNVLISGSDDSFIKVWDRRSLGLSSKPSGVLVGHTEGITNVSAKGDGRYIISNGKDQALRLWDLRKMHTSDEFDTFKHKNYSTGWDYRYAQYPRPKYSKHPRDCSVMTFHGHSVVRTLIRCYFSPAETTGQQYIYSGSADGRIHIWSLDGQIVQILDRGLTLPMSYDPSEREPPPRTHRLPCIVRDVSWHSQEPILMSAAWESRSSGSTVAQHHWKGLAKMRYNLEDWNERERAERAERSERPRRRQNPWIYADVDEDDEDAEMSGPDQDDFSEYSEEEVE
ncbi:WD40 repeat-like protein [Schizophyllum commune Loenen D]|nr:WD40 repeat-like protein [Schizophyllum commune Loenen D]